MWGVGDGEEAAGEGGQKDCMPWWGVELERGCDEGEEEGGRGPLRALPLLLDLTPLLETAGVVPIVPSIPAGQVKPF